MKRLFALMLALLMLGLPALAEPMGLLDYTDDILEDGSPIYYFQELSLTLPASWQGKVMAMPVDGGVAFYQIASHEAYQNEGLDGGGFLFKLGASVNGSFSQLPAFKYLGFSEASVMNYYLELPSDYPAYMDEAIRAEYDAMAGQIDDVVEGAAFYPGVNDEGGDEPETPTREDADQDAAQDAAANGGVTLKQARYHFEHSALPRYFYDDPSNMLTVLGEVGAYRLWTSLADENGVEYPYQPGDYAENWYTADDGTTVLQIIMPQPETDTLCYRVYMLYNPGTGDAGYYTVEYDGLLGDAAFLCGWSEDRKHINYGGAAILDAADAGYGAALLEEAGRVASLAGASASLTPGVSGGEPDDAEDAETEDAGNLALIECPEQGFTTMADPAYSWDYREDTGISIYTGSAGKIPYVIVYRGEDLLMEPFDYIHEQYTPHIQQKYGDDLADYEEIEAYEIGGKALPAGRYSYYVQGHLVDMLRLMDSTGNRTVSYTAKYLHGEGDATLAALDAAIRNFRAD